jgi:pSer/pThr/pTyr-binding forkhead associated (FHA) protein
MWVLRALGASEDPIGPLAFRLQPGTVNTIGRMANADFVVDAPLVSRLHCQVIVSGDDEVEVRDLDSTNGTWVDGAQIARAPLRDGSTLRIGRVEFVLERETQS